MQINEAPQSLFLLTTFHYFDLLTCARYRPGFPPAKPQGEGNRPRSVHRHHAPESEEERHLGDTAQRAGQGPPAVCVGAQRRQAGHHLRRLQRGTRRARVRHDALEPPIEIIERVRGLSTRRRAAHGTPLHDVESARRGRNMPHHRLHILQQEQIGSGTRARVADR